MGHPYDGQPIKTIGFDCDDTLWHNENIFQSTHDKFSSIVRPYVLATAGVPEEVIEKRLHDTEVKNLSLFGYGIKGFTLSMIETAIEATDQRISAADIHAIVSLGKQMLTEPVHVLEGVTATLQELKRQNYRLVALTKGDLFDQEGKVARSGLGDLFDHVEVMSEKDTATYAQVFDRQEIDPETFIMVGNSMRSDILPILELNGRAIYIPYYVTWAHEHVDLPQGLPKGAWRLATIAAVPGLISQFRQSVYK